MGYRDAETALQLRLEQLEQQVPALQEQVRQLTEANARAKFEADRLREELAAADRAAPPREVTDAGTVVLLTIRQPSGAGKVMAFTKNDIRIGTNPQCELVLDGDGIGDLHAVIERRVPEGVSIEDLSRTLDTMVNGSKIRKQLLRSGDVIRIGAHELEVDLRD